LADYILDRSWEPERRRLTLQEQTLDPMTFDHLERIGVQAGWRCLEVGAGAGSVVSWLADRVGPTGKVVAIDIDTKLIDHLVGPVIEVRNQDLMTAELSEGFDLVHCRLVLGHLPEKDEALGRLHEAVRPGGWMCTEEADSLYAEVDHPPVWPPVDAPNIGTALTRLWKETGFDSCWGRNLLARFCELGLQNIGGEVRSPLLDARSAEISLIMWARFRDEMIKRRYIAEDDLASWEEAAKHPDWKTFLWFLTSVWGQKPNAEPAAQS
jgi:SAM-dependent methyltransferase